MPSLKRNRLLSDLERQRLSAKRSELDRHVRATNDVRVKRKMAGWQNMISDVMFILQSMPEDQLHDVIVDWSIYLLLNIVERLMKIKKFCPIEGKPDMPGDWRTIVEIDEKTGQPTSVRPTEKLDIARASMLAWHIGIIGKYYIGFNNPIVKVSDLAKYYEKPEDRNRLSDGEKKAVELYNEAVKEFLEQTVKFRK